MFTTAVFVILKPWKQSKCPSTGERLNSLHPDHGILPSNKKEQTIDTGNSPNRSQGTTFSENSQSQKITYCPIPFI